MNKHLTVIAVLFAGIFNVHALDNLHFNVLGGEYAAGIQAHVDVSHVRLWERVYKDKYGSGLISEIDWDIGPQMAAGTGLLVGPADPFNTFGLSLWGNCIWYFPVNDRSMQDTDWDDNGEKINYGESIASALTGMEAEGRLAALFPLRGKFIIEAAAELWYGRYALTAHDGWTRLYGDTERIPLYGAAVEYVQEWIVFAPGIGLRVKLNNAHIGVKAAVSPFIGGYHIDNHYFRKLESDDPDQKYMTYVDNTRNGIYYRIQGDCLLNIADYVQLGIALDYRAIEDSRGDTTIMTTGLAGYSFVDKGTAGAAVRNLTIGLTIRTVL